MDIFDHYSVPPLQAVEQDIERLVEVRPVPGCGSYVVAIPQLVHVRALMTVRTRGMSNAEATDQAVITAVREAVGELGQSTEGKVAAKLLAEHPPGLVDRQQAAADAIGVDIKTIRRDRQIRAIRAVAERTYQHELSFLSRAALPAAWYRYDSLLRKLWAADGPNEVLLANGEIPTAQPQSRGAFHMQAGDVRALAEAYATLRELRPASAITILPSSEVHGAQLGCNIVSVGGPRWNVVTRALLEQLDPDWRFGDETGGLSTAIKSTATGTALEAHTTDEGEVLLTHGMILSACNPHNPESRVTVFAGLSTLGVLAVTRALTPATLFNSDSLAAIHAAFGDLQPETMALQIIVSTAVIDGEVVPTAIKPDSIFIKEIRK